MRGAGAFEGSLFDELYAASALVRSECVLSLREADVQLPGFEEACRGVIGPGAVSAASFDLPLNQLVCDCVGRLRDREAGAGLPALRFVLETIELDGRFARGPVDRDGLKASFDRGTSTPERELFEAYVFLIFDLIRAGLAARSTHRAATGSDRGDPTGFW